MNEHKKLKETIEINEINHKETETMHTNALCVINKLNKEKACLEKKHQTEINEIKATQKENINEVNKKNKALE